jgi:hypothetical protein
MSLIDQPGLDDLLLVAETAPLGDFAEVGVFKGGSAWHLNELCKKRGNKIHLFDTFEGMPEPCEIDVHKKGEFGNTSVEEVQAAIPDACIYQGLFPWTIPNDLYDLAFIHVDCDLYSSVKAAIAFLPFRMVKGGIMYFDDYQLEGVKAAIDGGLKNNIEIKRRGRVVWVKP